MPTAVSTMNSRLAWAMRLLTSGALGLSLLLGSASARADKLRDLCDVVGARDNQLVGYGVVTGLNLSLIHISEPTRPY